MSLEVSPTTGFQYLFNNVNDKVHKKSKNPIVFAVLISVVLIYVVIFKYLGITHNVSQEVKSGMGIKIIELLLWGVFLFLIFVNALQYFFEIDFKASVINLFGDNPR